MRHRVRDHHHSPENRSAEAPLVQATRRLVYVTALLVIVGILSFGAAVLQWLTMRSADKKTDNTIHIMQGQLDEMRSEQRPWVHSMDMPVVTKFLSSGDGNIHVEMKIDMENVGRSPAQDASGRIFIKTGGLTVDDNLRNEICTRAEWRDLLGIPGVRGVTISLTKRYLDAAAIGRCWDITLVTTFISLSYRA